MILYSTVGTSNLARAIAFYDAVFGKSGAAHLLGLPPSTVRYRMRKLGITVARIRVGPATSRSALGVVCLRPVPGCRAGMWSASPWCRGRRGLGRATARPQTMAAWEI